MENKKEYIICATVKRVKQRDCIKHYYNNDLYDIEIGYRHCDIFARFGDEISKNPYDQGFYTSKGRFVDRYEGMMIAYKAGQVDEKTAFNSNWENIEVDGVSNDNLVKKFKMLTNKQKYNKLYSEDLY